MYAEVRRSVRRERGWCGGLPKRSGSVALVALHRQTRHLGPTPQASKDHVSVSHEELKSEIERLRKARAFGDGRGHASFCLLLCAAMSLRLRQCVAPLGARRFDEGERERERERGAPFLTRVS